MYMDEVIATYYYRPKAGVDFEWAAQAIAEEQTTGTWTDISTTQDYVRCLDGIVHEVVPHNDGYVAKIGFADDIFELGSFPQYLSVVSGNLYGLSKLAKVRLLDLDLTKATTAPFKGPKFGIEGVRKLVGTDKSGRPHVGTIIKPKVGLNPKDTAQVSYNAAIGGVDLIKDDETLTDQKFCPMADRLPAVMEQLDRVKDDTGRTVLYAVNVSAPGDKILERAEEAIDLGANMLMIDFIVCGIDAVRVLAEDPSIQLPLHIHRTMHAAMTRDPEHGVAMRAFCRLIRMAGGDQLHTGTVSGKMDHDTAELLGDNKALTDPNFFGLKDVFPVASGGLSPGGVAREIEVLGKDIILQAGGGIHGHPSGTRAGATAMRQAVDAAMQGVTLEEYAKDHAELAAALDKWGMFG
jgi:ribulose-bisphosphate carboxylase large chain